MIVIPNDITMASVPCSAAPVIEEEQVTAPRRVSFRTNEVEYAKEIALLLQSEESDADCHKRSPLHEEEEDCQRGFELKRSLERQHRKFTILKSIVKNQRQCSPEYLGRLARVCSKWAAATARVQADWDFQDAYFNAKAALPSRTLPSMKDYPMPLKKRRSEGGEERSKKRVKLA